MDRQIARPGIFRKYRLRVFGLLIASCVIPFWWQVRTPSKTLSISGEALTFSTVSEGLFEDHIPIRGRVAPLVTVFIDSTQGGQVEDVFVNNGDVLTISDPILRLSNTQLQLDVIGREADIAEQRNALGDLELDLIRNRLAQKRQLVDINYAITRLERLVSTRMPLVPDAVSWEELKNLQDELEYNRKLQEIAIEAQEADEILQARQATQIKETLDRLEKNLIVTKENLSKLNVKASVDGQLTAFDVLVGQSISPGERIGRIDSPDKFKTVVEIDEFYLSRVDLEQQASVSIDGKRHTIEIVDINPEVTSGKFQVDFEFVNAQPTSIRRGQTLQGQLTLGDPTPSILISNGAFYQDTGGAWVFVVNTQGSEANRRPVKLGRRNSRYIEVEDGLEDGERIVISSYASFNDAQRLVINN